MVLLLYCDVVYPIPEALVANIGQDWLVYSIGMWWLAVELVLGESISKLIRV